MKGKKKAKASASTWLILTLVAVIACLCVVCVNSAKKNDTQATEITELKKQAKANEKTAAKSLSDKAEAIAYQKLFPDMKSAIPTEWERPEKTVYLTFDDGPSRVTPKILKTLKEADVKATFFVVGGGSDHSLLKEIADDGHAIGVHSYSHKYKEIYESVETYIEDFHRMYELIEEETGIKTTIYRYPGGSNNVYNVLNQNETTAEMFRRGFVPFDWNYDSRDATANTVSKKTIIGNADDGIGADRVVLLMHDSKTKSTTAEALPTIIKRYKKAGYKFGVLTNKVAPILFSTPDEERYK